jgi:hypothetical protein
MEYLLIDEYYVTATPRITGNIGKVLSRQGEVLT